MSSVPICPYSGLLVTECKQPQGIINIALGAPLCDCFDFPEYDEDDEEEPILTDPAARTLRKFGRPIETVNLLDD